MMIAEVFRKKTRFNDVVIKIEFYIVVDFKEFDTVTRFISTLTRRENTQKICVQCIMEHIFQIT